MMVTTSTALYLLLICLTVSSNDVRDQGGPTDPATVTFHVSSTAQIPSIETCTRNIQKYSWDIFRQIFACESLYAAVQLVSQAHEPGVREVLNVTITLFTENNTLEHHIDMNVQNMTIAGWIPSSISCNSKGSLLFRNISKLSLTNLMFVRCGSVRNIRAGVECSNCETVEVSHCSFTQSQFTALKFTSTDQENFTVAIHDTVFIRNGNLQGPVKEEKLLLGGGLFFKYHNMQVTNGRVLIQNCRFSDNSAWRGGAISIQITGILVGKATGRPALMFEVVSSSFQNNTVKRDGGAFHQYSQVSSSTVSLVSEVVFKGCNLTENTGRHGSAMLINVQRQSHLLLSDTIIAKNSGLDWSFGSVSTTIHASEAKIITTGTTILKGNRGTGLHLALAHLYVHGKLHFSGNLGNRGGGLQLHKSVMYLTSGSEVSFSHNRAVHGGAIYQNTVDQLDTPCLFKFDDKAYYYSSIIFSKNEAFISGNEVYLSNPYHRCYDVELSDPRVLGLNSTDCQEVMSVATKFKNSTEEPYDIALGQHITLNFSVSDFKLCPAVSNAQLLYISNSSNLPDLGQPQYSLNGSRNFVFQSNFQDTFTFLEGPEITETAQYILHIKTEDQVVRLHLNITPCRIGFKYMQERRVCDCIESPYIRCNTNRSMACIRRGYWAGEVGGVSTVYRCYTGHCRNINIGVGGCELCPGDSMQQGVYCALLTEQCIANRAGTVCGDCMAGFSFTYGAVMCVEDHTCSGSLAVVPAAVILAFIAVNIALLVIFLKLDNHINSAHLYCFVYYFSIVGHLLPANRVGPRLLPVVSVFKSVTQLNPFFLGYVPMCFISQLSAVDQLPFQYLYPILIASALLTLVGLSRCFPRCIRFSNNTVIRAITVIILLSFTALTETSFRILKPVQLANQGHYISIQPSRPYFYPAHIVWFMIAVFVMLFLVIPFTIFLFIAPFLMQCINLTKVKPFLDEFQGCYKDRFRWMAGVYFFCRFVYLGALIFSGVYLTSLTTFAVQLISIAVLLFHAIIQPYQNMWLNVVDTIMLGDLLLVSVLYSETANEVFHNMSLLQEVIAFILVLIPALYLIILALSISKCFRRVVDIATCKCCHGQQSSHWHESQATQNHQPSFSGDREPLIGLLGEQVAAYNQQANVRLDTPYHQRQDEIEASSLRPVTFSDGVSESLSWVGSESTDTGNSAVSESST